MKKQISLLAISLLAIFMIVGVAEETSTDEVTWCSILSSDEINMSIEELEKVPPCDPDSTDDPIVAQCCAQVVEGWDACVSVFGEYLCYYAALDFMIQCVNADE